MDGDTLEVYDEYLRCPLCDCRHDVPWGDNSDFNQDSVVYEGDVIRILKPETPAHQCPKCRSTNVKYVEDYEISRDVRPPPDDFEDHSENPE